MSSLKAIFPAHSLRDHISENSSSSAAATAASQSPSTPRVIDRGISGVDIPGSEILARDISPDTIPREEEKPKRKRKVQGKVAIIACLECRRTRSRCDGEAPSPCVRCRTRGYRCIYQPHTKIQKDEILNDLEQERARAESLSQRNHELSMILHVISSDGHLEEIVQRLRRKEDAKTIATWLSTLPELQLSIRRNSLGPTDIEEVVDKLSLSYRVDTARAGKDEIPRTKWTRVTRNHGFVDYLVRLYLARIHVNCMLFNEAAFMQSYESGDGSACSKALLNAMCALACNLLDRRHIATEADAADIAHLTESFLAEGRSSISLADSQNITTIQAMAVMYIADLSSGKARSANTYLKSASENLRSLEPEIELTADFDLSRWGIHTLDTISCAFTYNNPFSPISVNTAVIFDGDQELYNQFSPSLEHSLNKSVDTSRLAIRLAAIKARLCQLVHGMIGLYGGSSGRVTPDRLLNFFRQYNELFESIPYTIRQAENSELGLDIRSLHIKFYCMISTLWSPLVSYAQAQRNEEMFNNCRYQMLEACRKAVSMIEGSLRDGSCEFLLPQYVFCVVNVCDSLARWTTNREEQLHALHVCFRSLDRNSLCFKLCVLLKKLVWTEMERFIDPEMLEELKTQYELRDTCTVEEALDATTRLTYVTPFPSMTKWLEADFQQQWADTWPGFRGPSAQTPVRTTSTGTNVMRVEDICN